MDHFVSFTIATQSTNKLGFHILLIHTDAIQPDSLELREVNL